METRETTGSKALKDDEASNPGHLQTETVKKGNENYSVQIGAWRNAEYAEETLNKLKPHYTDTYIAVENNFSKIRIPGITTKRQGELIINDIKEKFNLNPILIPGRKD
ncbi:MAG: SPOR domain-containing protein [Candidatus Mariimomonas ferrooxydans]